MENSEYFKTLEEWRKWLSKNHDKESEIWMIYYKKHTGKPTIGYEESVLEALCWGWIDSIIKRIDDEKYVRKFTPRINYENWSDSNINRMKKLIAENRIHKVGLEKFPLEHLSRKLADKPKKLIIPEYIQTEIDKFPKAKKNFEKLAPSHKRNYLGWIDSAKQEETKLRRLAKALDLLQLGKKLGMK
ncbi:YdeI family protein [Candidatus Cloacimonadota bacterium]